MTRTTKTVSGLAGLYLLCLAFIIGGPYISCTPAI